MNNVNVISIKSIVKNSQLKTIFQSLFLNNFGLIIENINFDFGESNFVILYLNL